MPQFLPAHTGIQRRLITKGAFYEIEEGCLQIICVRVEPEMTGQSYQKSNVEIGDFVVLVQPLEGSFQEFVPGCFDREFPIKTGLWCFS